MTPDQHTAKEFFIEVGNGHQLYVHDWGNKRAKLPIIFLHGGPGSSNCRDKNKMLFDPGVQRVIFFDQRGAGRSMPYGSIKHNTTQDLVEDIEKIATHLKLKKFVLTGGSWGSTLALAYGLKYPKRVAAMVLDGIFTGSQSEIDWLDKGGFRSIFPDAWERYVQATPKSHQHNPSAYHFKRILSDDADAARVSGYAYETMEGSVMNLDDRFAYADPTEYDPSGVRIEVHYLANRCFMPDRHLLQHARKLPMPIWLVQGRYDIVCPPVTAYELDQKLPNSHLIFTVSNHRSEHETYNVTRTILAQLTEKS
jgi:proline iminopeptidase